MCGLVGVLGQHINAQDEKVFQQLLTVDVLRGKHSTGITAVDKDGGAGYLKIARPSFNMLNDKDVDAEQWFRDNKNSVAFLGHNRAATRGAVTTANSHPFQHGDITLMHNGTLIYYDTLPEHNKFAVDSEAIAYSINKLGVQETVSKLCGAWALSYANTADGTINFCRNDERPLWFARLRNTHGSKQARNKWVYGSEKGLLKWIIERNGLEAVNFFQIKPEKLVTFDATGDFSGFEVSDLEYTEDKAAASYFQAMRTHYPKAQSRSHSTTKTGATSTKSGSGSSPSSSVGKFNVGHAVPFWPEKFDLHSSAKGITDDNAMGSILGQMSEYPYYRVRINSVRADSLDLVWSEVHSMWMLKDGEYSANLLSSYHSQVMNTNVAILQGSSLKLVTAFDHDSSSPMLYTANPKTYTMTDPTEEENSSEDQESFEQLQPSNIIPFNPDSNGFVRGPRGVFVPVETFLMKVDDGCSNCGDCISPEDAEHMHWMDAELPLCPNCTHTFSAELGIG